ncbi:signal peptide CUB and EGF-like domain-containing protein 2, partial [Biomphalaria glabrata]
VQRDTPQCDLRALIDPCESNENCNVDDEGISYCQIQLLSSASILEGNIFDYLGLGVGVSAGIALTITIIVIFYNRKVKYYEKSTKESSSK